MRNYQNIGFSTNWYMKPLLRLVFKYTVLRSITKKLLIRRIIPFNQSIMQLSFVKHPNYAMVIHKNNTVINIRKCTRFVFILDYQQISHLKHIEDEHSIN